MEKIKAWLMDGPILRAAVIMLAIAAGAWIVAVGGTVHDIRVGP